MSSVSAQGLVLVVDDQLRNLEVVKMALMHDGFEVMTAADSAAALQCLVTRVPDLILLDVIMPLVNGFELCTQIKENAAWRDIPVIFLSGDDHHGSIRTGFQLGGVDYIIKPFNKEELLARVRTHVELRHAQQRNALQLIERNRVLSLIANEWHKPLQRIVLNNARIKEICKDLDPETAEALLAEAHSAEKMLASIETFLQLKIVDHPSHDGDNQNSFNSHELAKLVGRWYATAKRKPVDIQLHNTNKPIELADISFMARQMVDAILANAIAYTAPGGSVVVRITSEGDHVALQVKDDGPGFPTEYLTNPFQPYLRKGQYSELQNNHHSSNALGIGLAVTKRAADRCGAKVAITNAQDGGAIVKVLFPVTSPTLVEI